MEIRTVQATRYVTPLREGGSLPAIIEADDSGLYVLKFRGAGQGPLALVAELVAGLMGRALGLPVPELVLVELDAALGRNEPDQEIQDLLRASAGLNIAMDYLPGSVTFDPAAGDRPAPDLASRIIWFDALITNIDRTPRNPNLLMWHRQLYLIDHGAALYFHHQWERLDEKALSPFAPIRQHVLLPWASQLAQADEELRPLLAPALLSKILELIPDAWLTRPSVEATAAQIRAAYLAYFEQRLAASAIFIAEAQRAHAQLI